MFSTIDDAAEWWDAHSTADDWDETREVSFEIDSTQRRIAVPIERHMADRIRAQAMERGISFETLVNLWLQERLQGPPHAA